jgi:hypothetical protein
MRFGETVADDLHIGPSTRGLSSVVSARFSPFVSGWVGLGLVIVQHFGINPHAAAVQPWCWAMEAEKV